MPVEGNNYNKRIYELTKFRFQNICNADAIQPSLLIFSALSIFIHFRKIGISIFLLTND